MATVCGRYEEKSPVEIYRHLSTPECLFNCLHGLGGKVFVRQGWKLPQELVRHLATALAQRSDCSRVSIPRSEMARCCLHGGLLRRRSNPRSSARGLGSRCLRPERWPIRWSPYNCPRCYSWHLPSQEDGLEWRAGLARDASRYCASRIGTPLEEEAIRQDGRSDVVDVLGRHAAGEEAVAPMPDDIDE